MTFTHEDVHDRLVDFLYDGLDAAARAAFVAHVSDCERCRKEVAALQRTREVARQVVRAPLSQPVPAPARSRILEAASRAAAEAVAARAGAAARSPERPSGAAAAPAEAKPQPVWRSWLDKVSQARSRWMMPTFATVAALGAFLLVRQTIFREAKRPLGDAPAQLQEQAPERTPAASAGKGAAASPPAASAGPPAEPREAADDRVVEHAVRPATAPAKDRSPGALAQRRFAVPPAKPAPSAGGAGTRTRDALGAEDIARRAGGNSFDKEESAGARMDRMDRRVAAAPAMVDRALAGPGEGFAQPPPAAPMAASAPAPRRQRAAPVQEAVEEPKAEPRAVAAESESADREARRTPAAGAAAAPPPPAAIASQSAQRAPRGESDDRAPAAKLKSKKSAERETDADESDGAVPSGGAGAAPDPTMALTVRAEKAMTARRWADAIAAYRELLARFPNHPAAPAWKRRLSAAQAADAADKHR